MSSAFAFDHDGQSIAYTVLPSRSRRGRVTVRLRADGQVVVTAPRSVPRDFVHQFVRERGDWIMRHRTRLLASQATLTPYTYAEGEMHWLHGEACPLRLQLYERTRPVVSRYEDGILIHSRCHEPDTVKRALYGWYKQQLQAEISADIEALRVRLPWLTETPPFTLKLLRSRWGSCSSARRLNFNLHLVKAPPHVRRYVVLHELCHLVEMNHSPRFWRLVEDVMPEWAGAREYLRKHGPELMRS